MVIGGGLFFCCFLQRLLGGIAEPLPGNADEFCRVGPVGAIVLQRDGKILLADAYGLSLHVLNRRTGVFFRLPGGVFRLHSNGSPDLTFVSELNDIAQSHVFDRWLAVEEDGKVLVQRPNWDVARLLPDGRLDRAFAVQNVSSNVPAVWADLNVVLPFATGPGRQVALRAGSTNRLPPVSGTSFRLPLTAVHWLDSSGVSQRVTQWEDACGLDGVLSSRGFSLWRRETYTQPSTGVSFLAHNQLKLPLRDQFGRPEAAAVLRNTLDRLPVDLCRVALRLPDGKIVLAVIQGGTRGKGQFLRFNRDWTLDPEFEASYEIGARSNTILLRTGPNGTVLVSGDFTAINGSPAAGLTRLLPNGTTDPTFRVTFTETHVPYPASVTVQADGSVLVGGLFTAVNDVKCTYLARLRSDGSVDREFTDKFEHDRYQEAFKGFRASVVQVVPGKYRSSDVTGSVDAPPQGTTDVDLENVWLRRLDFADGAAVIEFEGTAQRRYVLQAQADPSHGWWSVSTNRTDTAGRGRCGTNRLRKRPCGSIVWFASNKSGNLSKDIAV